MTDLTVVPIDTDFYGDLPPDQVLEGAKGQLERVVVLGITKEGEIWISDTQGTVSSTNLMLDRAKAKLLRSIDD